MNVSSAISQPAYFSKFAHLRMTRDERIVREVGYGLALEGASAATLVQQMKPKAA